MHGLTEDDYRRRIAELLEERDRACQRVTRERDRGIAARGEAFIAEEIRRLAEENERLRQHAGTIETRNADLERGLEAITRAQEALRRAVDQLAQRERARIRRELLDEIGKIPPGRLAYDPEVVHALLEVRKALDCACPAE